jgi:hypothetical protein
MDEKENAGSACENKLNDQYPVIRKSCPPSNAPHPQTNWLFWNAGALNTYFIQN